MPKIEVDKDLCKGCGICVEFCPNHVLEMSTEMNKNGFHMPKPAHTESCTLCGLCEMYCPDFAICARKDEM